MKTSTKKQLNFKEFAAFVQSYELQNTECNTSAHHSNGSGKDWEALQKEIEH